MNLFGERQREALALAGGRVFGLRSRRKWREEP